MLQLRTKLKCEFLEGFKFAILLLLSSVMLHYFVNTVQYMSSTIPRDDHGRYGHSKNVINVVIIFVDA